MILTVYQKERKEKKKQNQKTFILALRTWDAYYNYWWPTQDFLTCLYYLTFPEFVLLIFGSRMRWGKESIDWLCISLKLCQPNQSLTGLKSGSEMSFLEDHSFLYFCGFPPCLSKNDSLVMSEWKGNGTLQLSVWLERWARYGGIKLDWFRTQRDPQSWERPRLGPEEGKNERYHWLLRQDLNMQPHDMACWEWSGSLDTEVECWEGEPLLPDT